jgi:Rrf2 family protein
MLEMGLAYGKGSMQLSQIAEHQDISPKYLVHLLASLKAAGLVKTVRGARGGYLLDKPPSDIKLIEIFRVLEGSTSPVECVDDPKTCSKSGLCVTRGVWARIRDAMNEVLESTTLQDLIVERKQKEEARKEMYYI